MTKDNISGVAIVLGGSTNGLGVIRSLGRIGVRCGLVYFPDNAECAQYSRYVIESLAVAKKSSDAELLAVLDQIREALGGERPVVIPTADRFSQFLSINQTSLLEKYRINCASQTLMDSFLDKWKTARICNANGVLIPNTLCPTTEAEVRQGASGIRFPVIIKPRYTFFGEFPGKNVTAENMEDLTDFFLDHGQIGDAVVQEVIPSGDGDIFAIASYSDTNGKVRATVCWRKLRQYRPDYGATCFGIIERQHQLESYNRKFLEAIGYRGFSMTEFARSRSDSKMYFLELNTRTSWPNQLFADAGVDLTQLAYYDMMESGSRYTGKLAPREGTVWLDYRRDRASARIKRQMGELGFWEWASSLIKARSFAHWSLRDPMPFVMISLWRMRRFFNKVAKIQTG